MSKVLTFKKKKRKLIAEKKTSVKCQEGQKKGMRHDDPVHSSRTCV